MLHEVDRVVFSVTDGVKGWWTVGKVRALVKELNEAVARGQLHMHLISGAEEFCTAKVKVTVFVEAPEKKSASKQQGELASGSD